MTTQVFASQPPHSQVGFRGPSLRWVGIVYPALFVASLILAGVLTGGARIPRPDDPLASSQAYYLHYNWAVRATAFLQFGSAIPLGIFTATAASQLRYLGVRAAGASIAEFGGYAAALFQAVSGLIAWTLSQPHIIDDIGSMHALQLLAFAMGGAGYIVPLGLLTAGISVTSFFGKILPRWLTGLGLAVAIIAELSTLSLIAPQASILLPLARFPALLWIVCTGFLLPSSKNAYTQGGARK